MKKLLFTLSLATVCIAHNAFTNAVDTLMTSVNNLTSAVATVQAPACIATIKTIDQCSADLTNCIQKISNPGSYPAPLQALTIGMCDPNEHAARTAMETLKIAINDACTHYSEGQSNPQWLHLFNAAQQNLAKLKQQN